MTVLCKNCKYFMNNDFPISLKYGQCKLSNKVTPEIIDPIDGKITPSKNDYNYASIYRKYDCIDGKFYEHEPDAFQRFLNQQTGTAKWSCYIGVYVLVLLIAHRI
jgi:hypothetical protein